MAMAKDLSILIPARNEEFLAHTVEDILSNIEADTEVIVVLDGEWANPPLPIHERVTVVKLPESIGQRAATNLACRLSEAKYVMKCDAHVIFDKGFDRKMIEDMQDDWTMVPKMYNLHVFDWVCKECGNNWYQGQTPQFCMKYIDKDGEAVLVQNKDCGSTDFDRDFKWIAKPSPETTSMAFDKDLKFQYWSDYKKHQKGDLVETMSLLGACWMLTREKYWELEICDEGHGSWGQQGTEVACKTWLSGGRLICTKKTWFAHLFRTQGGDFGFPYPLSGNDVQRARDYSKNLWLNGNWDKAKYPLEWLIEKFAPVPDWHTQDSKDKNKPSKAVLYYSDNRKPLKMLTACQGQICKGIKEKHVTSITLEPTDLGANIHLPLERGWLTMAKQILIGLIAISDPVVFFCEDDVLYHPSHFDFIPPKKDVFYYNNNVWKLRASDGLLVRCDDMKQLSGLVAYRDLLIEHFTKRVERIEKEGYTMKMGFEPGTHNRKERIDDYGSDTYESEYPNIDIRHDQNATKTKWSPDEFRNKKYAKGWRETNEVPGWGSSGDILHIFTN